MAHISLYKKENGPYLNTEERKWPIFQYTGKKIAHITKYRKENGRYLKLRFNGKQHKTLEPYEMKYGSILEKCARKKNI